jgi:hypothetical protein
VVDLFNIEFKLPAIEKMALMQAMFNPEPMQVKMDDEAGKAQYYEADASIYYQPYEFTIEDNKSELERKENLQEKIALIQQGAAIPSIMERAEWVKLYAEVWRDLGYGSAMKWFRDDRQQADYVGKELMINALGQSLAMQAMALMAPEVVAQRAAQQVMEQQTNGQDPTQAPQGNEQQPIGPPGMGGVEGIDPATLLEAIAGQQPGPNEGEQFPGGMPAQGM